MPWGGLPASRGRWGLCVALGLRPNRRLFSLGALSEAEPGVPGAGQLGPRSQILGRRGIGLGVGMYWKGWLCAGDHGLSNALGSMVSSRKVTGGVPARVVDCAVRNLSVRRAHIHLCCPHGGYGFVSVTIRFRSCPGV